MRRVRAPLLSAVLILSAGVGYMYAHAAFLRSDPAPGSLQQSSPERVRIWFSEPIEAAADPVVITDPAGARVDTDARVAPDDRTALEAHIRSVAQGTYAVRWNVVSEDGHPIGGRFRFSVGTVSLSASARAADAETEEERGILGAAIARWLHLIGATIALGALALLVILPEAMPDEVRRRLLSTSLFGAVVLLLASPAMLLAQTVAAQGSLSPQSIAGVLDGRWGSFWLTRFTATCVLLAAVWLARAHAISLPFPRRRGWIFIGLLAGLALLVFTSANGHAIATQPVGLTMFVDVVHLSATAVWLGGLFALMFAVFPGLSRTIADRRVAHLGELVSRFSMVAFVCVEVLLVTGLYQTWAHVDTPAALVQTVYGRTLLIKLVLFTLVLLPAALNLLIMRPRFEAERGRTLDIETGEHSLIGPFTRMISIEALLGVAILAAAAALSAMPPARRPGTVPQPTLPMPVMMEHAAAQPALLLSVPAGAITLTLTLDPARTGSNHALIEARDSLGQIIPLKSGRIRATAPHGSAATNSVSVLAPAGGALRATLGLDAPGSWQLEINAVSQSGLTPTVSFPVRVRALEQPAVDPEAS